MLRTLGLRLRRICPLGVFLFKEVRKVVITVYMQDASDAIEKESWLYCRKIIATFLEEG